MLPEVVALVTFAKDEIEHVDQELSQSSVVILRVHCFKSVIDFRLLLAKLLELPVRFFLEVRVHVLLLPSVDQLPLCLLKLDLVFDMRYSVFVLL